jgi:hypothetical protein
MSSHAELVSKGNRSAGLSWSIGDEDYEVKEKSAQSGSPAAPAKTGVTPIDSSSHSQTAGDHEKAAEVFPHFADGPASANPAAHLDQESHGHGHGKDHEDPKRPGVRAVQKILSEMGLYESDGKAHHDVDGKLGPRTFAAIMKADPSMRQEMLKWLSPHDLLAYHQFAGDGKAKEEPDFKATKDA